MTGQLPQHSETGVPREGESIFLPPAKPDYRIDTATGCWEWLKGKTSRGYPDRYAHRRYFQRANPSVNITGLHVHHQCENPGCVNPAHLEALTPHEHERGHGRGRSNLTEQDVADIRASRQTSVQLAAHYGVDQGVIENIWCGPDWPGVGSRRKPLRLCAWCGEEVPQERNRQAIYCSKGCRIRARWRRKQDERPGTAAAYQRAYRARKRLEAAD